MTKETTELELRVTRLHHTHKGVTYRVGDTFTGTTQLLEAFGDRLEPASMQAARDAAASDTEGTPGKPAQATDKGPAVPNPPAPPAPPPAAPPAPPAGKK